MPDMLDLMAPARNFYFDAVSQIRMPSWTKGRVALVADANGGGLHRTTELTTIGDHRTAFVRYQDGLARLLHSKQDAAVGLGLAFEPKNRLELIAQNTEMRLMGLPKVADIVVEKNFHEAGELPPFPTTDSVS
ncbi:hypothetical protein IV500_12405 [Paeniglutamicibacter antarcticus]|uniref:Uncharacterized protein n=1 Tax=Arthrobacter terrae TaxID=2935737 RepID=A0A931CKD0_9MICC|nr:hypothetical protein [Arthrobacter terrae]MBG0740182.1 hypothetical protein [Arthrobacter terrae]